MKKLMGLSLTFLLTLLMAGTSLAEEETDDVGIARKHDQRMGRVTANNLFSNRGGSFPVQKNESRPVLVPVPIYTTNDPPAGISVDISPHLGALDPAASGAYTNTMTKPDAKPRIIPGPLPAASDTANANGGSQVYKNTGPKEGISIDISPHPGALDPVTSGSSTNTMTKPDARPRLIPGPTPAASDTAIPDITTPKNSGKLEKHRQGAVISQEPGNPNLQKMDIENQLSELSMLQDNGVRFVGAMVEKKGKPSLPQKK